MNQTFEKIALIVRAVESFHEHARQRFERLTKHATKGSRDISLNRMSPERIAESLRAYQRDIESANALLTELRSDLANLAEGRGRDENPYDAGTAHPHRPQ